MPNAPTPLTDAQLTALQALIEQALAAGPHIEFPKDYVHYTVPELVGRLNEQLSPAVLRALVAEVLAARQALGKRGSL